MLMGKFGTHSETPAHSIRRNTKSEGHPTVIPPENCGFKLNDNVFVLSTGNCGSIWMFKTANDKPAVILKLDTGESSQYVNRHLTVPLDDIMLISEWDESSCGVKSQTTLTNIRSTAAIDQHILHSSLEAVEKGFQMHKHVRIKETGNKGVIVGIQNAPSVVFVDFQHSACILRVRYSIGFGFSVANFSIDELELIKEEEYNSNE